MSESESVPAGTPSIAFDTARERAKALLRHARAGSPAVLTELRAHLPRLASLDDATVAATIKLADVQHAIARQQGKASWGELKQELQQLDPLHVQAARFLRAVQNGDAERAVRLLGVHPGLARFSAATAAAACDADALATILAVDPAQATVVVAPDTPPPIIFASGTPLFAVNPQMALDSVRCVTLLLDAGASANAAVPVGDDAGGHVPALYFACIANNVRVVELLLDRGADPNDGESVYHSAEHNHRECLALLLRNGANLSAAHPQYHNTPLFFLAGYTDANPTGASSALGMEWLLDHGADPSVPSYVGTGTADDSATPLHRVASNHRGVALAASLVEHGALVDAQRTDGTTAYMLAVRTGNTSVADYLRTCGADTAGVTPIDEFLGACANADREAALDVLGRHPDLWNRMTVEDKEALARAAAEDKLESVRLMVSLGWDLGAEGAWGGSALHHAAWHGRPSMTRLLLSLGAPVNMRDSNFGSSPMGWAAHGSVNGRAGQDDDYVAVVEQLLDAGSTRAASVNKWNEPPEAMSSRAVARLLKQRGFAP